MSYVFVHSGWIKNPPDIDISDIGTQLCVWENCKEFNISQNITQKLREVRNKYFAHNSAAEITDQRLSSIFNVFWTLLHDNDLTTNIDAAVVKRKLKVLEDDPIYGSQAEQRIAELKQTLKCQDIKLNAILERTEHRTKRNFSLRFNFDSFLKYLNIINVLYLIITFHNILPGTINLFYSNQSTWHPDQEYGNLCFL